MHYLKTVILTGLIFLPLAENCLVYASDIFKVSAIDWCPQVCPNQPNRPGYLVEIIQGVFKESEYKVDIEFTPWSRAIYNVRKGKTDALLSPSKEEAPDLYYHEDPIAYQTHCFWKLKESKWTYTGVDSLKDIRIVIYKDNPYGELINQANLLYGKSHFVELNYDKRYLDRSVALLKKKRAESFLFTANSVFYSQRIKNINELALGKCIRKDKLWIPLTPKKTKRIEKIKKFLDINIIKFKKTKNYDDILKKYNIINPQTIDYLNLK